MRAAIMQPTYLPWLGYFALMEQVDTFVLLEDVQFSHQSWQHRNRIRSAGSVQWLTVPVSVKGRGSQRIDEVLIDNARSWQKKHLRTILQGYARAPWLAAHRPALESIYADPPRRLCELNRLLIESLAQVLGVDVLLRGSSELHAGGDRIGRLIEICRGIGADEYLSPIGSYDYIAADNLFPQAGIRLLYQHYEHPVYRQVHGGFIAFLSVIDLLLNEGPGSLDVIRSGTRQPYTGEELRALRLEVQT